MLLQLLFILQGVTCLTGQETLDCDFSTDLCGYSQDYYDDFDWTRIYRNTPSIDTGPSMDHTTGTSSGYYIYTEVSSISTGYKARLQSPLLDTHGSYCVEFYYHMYGSSIGSLNVYAKTSSRNNPIWSRHGPQGDQWNLGQIQLYVYTTTQIVFEGIRGTTFRGDIALDDIRVVAGSCSLLEGDVLTTIGDGDWQTDQGLETQSGGSRTDQDLATEYGFTLQGNNQTTFPFTEGYTTDILTTLVTNTGGSTTDNPTTSSDGFTLQGNNQTTFPYNSFDIRLVGGTSHNEGRVEVRYNNQWGTVCDDGWDLNDTTVACRQLGYQGADAALSSAYFGQGTGSIWMDNLYCSGTETSLDQCQHNGFGSHNCGHGEDAGVRCSANEPRTDQAATTRSRPWTHDDGSQTDQDLVTQSGGSRTDEDLATESRMNSDTDEASIFSIALSLIKLLRDTLVKVMRRQRQSDQP